MKVFYRTPEGVRVRGWAHYDVMAMRWMVGDTPLDDLKEITEREWVLGGDGPEWIASAEAFIR